MKTYNQLGQGVRRSFQVSFGLSAGYGADAKTFTLEQAKAALHAWMGDRIARGLPYLTGQLVAATTVYAWPQDGGKAGLGEEKGALFVGEVSVLYDATATDEDVTARLFELASAIGNALEQIRVYLAYKDETWVVQREESTTPTGN